MFLCRAVSLRCLNMAIPCRMDMITFTLEIEERKFLCEQVLGEKEGMFLYILPYDKAEKGFFMSQADDGAWKVLYRFIVAPSVLKMEDILSQMIRERLESHQ